MSLHTLYADKTLVKNSNFVQLNFWLRPQSFKKESIHKCITMFTEGSPWLDQLQPATHPWNRQKINMGLRVMNSTHTDCGTTEFSPSVSVISRKASCTSDTWDVSSAVHRTCIQMTTLMKRREEEMDFHTADRRFHLSPILNCCTQRAQNIRWTSTPQKDNFCLSPSPNCRTQEARTAGELPHCRKMISSFSFSKLPDTNKKHRWTSTLLKERFLTPPPKTPTNTFFKLPHTWSTEWPTRSFFKLPHT